MTDNTEQPTLATEGKWHVIKDRVVDGMASTVAVAINPATAARIVSDHNAAQSQAGLVEALRGLKRVNSHCYCLTWVGGEHEPECIAARAALKAAGVE